MANKVVKLTTMFVELHFPSPWKDSSRRRSRWV